MFLNSIFVIFLYYATPGLTKGYSNPLNKRARIDMIEGHEEGRPNPHLIGEQLQNYTVRKGSDVTFACVVENLGNYRVAWLHSIKGTLAVHPHVITHNDRISVSHDNRETYLLQLKSVKESDAGKYICQLNTGPPISIRGVLNVVVPPDIMDDESSSEILATEGTRVELVCKARGNPKPSISWKREDHKNIILCSDKLGYIRSLETRKRGNKQCREVEFFRGSTLVLPEVSRFDSGNYLCLASNGVPPIVSKRVKIHVEFPPNMWISHQLIGVEVGGTAVLECLTAANPTSLNFWIKEGPRGKDFLINKGRYIVEQIDGEPSYYNIQMKMKILNITKKDYGNYTCLAKNPQGQTSGKIVLYEVQSPTVSTTIAHSPVQGFDPYSKLNEESVEDASSSVPKVNDEGKTTKISVKHFSEKNPKEIISKFDLKTYKKKTNMFSFSTSSIFYSTLQSSSSSSVCIFLSFLTTIYLFSSGLG